MKIVLIGYGFVGKAMKRLFPDARIYDPMHPALTISQQEANECDVAFVCVPTTMMPDGSCDTSIVEEVVGWLTTPLIIIRSTIKPGTTTTLIARHGEKHIVFQPEYVGETTAHPLLNESERTFLIFGGAIADCSKAVEVYQQVYNSSVKIQFFTPLEAELIKYFENTTIGTMVTLSNEFYNICRAFGVEYHMVREGLLLDPRMSRYFTFVYPERRGFEGKCLPKDITALARASERAGYTPEFIQSILKNNDRIRGAAHVPAPSEYTAPSMHAPYPPAEPEFPENDPANPAPLTDYYTPTPPPRI